MSTVVTKNVQVGTSGTPANNFTLYQPASPDGTVRLANGNSGSTTDLVTVNSSGNVGIGTASPGALLDVSAAGTAVAKLTNRNSGATEVVLSLDAGGNGVSVRDSQIRGGNNGGNQTYLSFYTANADTPVERARISAAGALTTPYQPMCCCNNANSATQGTDVIFSNKVFDTTSSYNTSNGRYTAPVSGVYYVQYNQLAPNAPAGEYRTAVYKNGGGYGGFRFITVKPAGSWWTLMAWGLVYLTAGDFITIRIEQASEGLYSDGNYTGFIAQLVG